jgi:uncharacterized protein YlxW (UPF0749 family)
MTTVKPSTSRSGSRPAILSHSSILLAAAFLLTGLILGILLSLVQQPAAPPSAPTGNQELDRVWIAIERLETEQRQLKTDLTTVRQALSDRLHTLQAELDRQRLLAGLAPVHGPGVVVILDDSAVQVPAEADPNTYIIHEYDLRDIINLLWMAGSEAIAVNDERLVDHSSLYCVGSTVMVNNTRLSPPYLIRAIGNARLQQDTLRNPSYLKELKQKERLYGLRFDVMEQADLTLPAYSGSFLMQHARPGD